MVKNWTEQSKPDFTRLMRLETLIRIRWIAIFFQTACICAVAFGLEFKMQMQSCFAIIALSVAFNLFLIFYYPRRHRIPPSVATLIFAIDILLLSCLLYYTGGLENPFALLLIAPVGLAATSLFFGSVLILNALAAACALLLAFFHQPLPWYAGQAVNLPDLFTAGLFLAILIAMIFISLDSYRLAEEARRFSSALGVTELMLQKERYISALDGLAAAAVHELGTPLSTIHLVATDFHKELGGDARYKEDVGLLLSQSERCRSILASLGTMAREEADKERVPLSQLLEEVVQPARGFGIEIELRKGMCAGGEPQVPHGPAVNYSLSNLVENAVDFAKSRVCLDYSWNKDNIFLSIVDDGAGYSPETLDKIGEPYISGRRGKKEKGAMCGGGMGLGLFISKTLLERMNITLSFRNSADKNLGAEVDMVWPAPFDAEPEKFCL